MTILMEDPRASGAPGIEPRWTHSAKDVVGTAYSAASPIWFTASGGVISEVYYPTIDRPQIRDLQYLVTDGQSFLHDVHRHQDSFTEYLDNRGLGVRITNADRDGRYRVVMEVIADPHQPCILLDTRLEGTPICCNICICSCCSRHISMSADGATLPTWLGFPGTNF
jgi:glucoamylase